MEEAATVPLRYTEALRQLVGRQLFERSLREVRGRMNASPTAKPIVRAKARATRRAGADPDQSRTEERFQHFLNALPSTGNSIAWIVSFRDALREFLGDVDRVILNVNLDCDLENPDSYHTDQIVTEHIQSRRPIDGHVEVTINREESVPSERLLNDFRRQGYPLERYRQPIAFDFYLGSQAYLGTIFLWREIANPPISDRTLALMRAFEPFFMFALSDLVARARQTRPQDRAFNDSLSHMISSANLSDQERRVVMLQLFGHSYEQIADKLCFSIDAVRKHVKSIYRKTDTHSYIELFAKYFTPRLGF
jgi:DNA-binding CsgD family transcriptional regulator